MANINLDSIKNLNCKELKIEQNEGISYAVIRKLFSEAGQPLHSKTEVEAKYNEIIKSVTGAKDALKKIIKKAEGHVDLKRGTRSKYKSRIVRTGEIYSWKEGCRMYNYCYTEACRRKGCQDCFGKG
ncbi:hypothetical protein KBC86_04970 [Candidatus Gracilibacteria bacterium]|nr:hypothetical protein [Candidatus Gracilibacteria bacterium]